MQLLNNLFEVCWKWKNADIICYKLTPLVSLQQKSKIPFFVKNPKKWWESIKIANIDRDLLNSLRNFNEIFRKDVTLTCDNIKSHKKPVFHPLFRRYIFQKTAGGRGSNCYLRKRKRCIITKIPGLSWTMLLLGEVTL